MKNMRKSFPLFKRIIISCVLFLSIGSPAISFIAEPAEILADQTLESRARSINRKLRCMVCQNQSIEDSNTELASDMRRLVREKVMSGATDDDIIRFLTDRYGDFVALMPPFKASTWPLWLAPVFFLLMALLAVRRSLLQGDKDTPLSEEERRRVHLLMQGESPHG